MATLAGIQLDAEQAESVDAEADGPLGVAGDVVELEALTPFFLGGAVRVAGVLVDVEIAQAEAGRKRPAKSPSELQH